jgi:hypothetical protein
VRNHRKLFTKCILISYSSFERGAGQSKLAPNMDGWMLSGFTKGSLRRGENIGENTDGPKRVINLTPSTTWVKTILSSLAFGDSGYPLRYRGINGEVL